MVIEKTELNGCWIIVPSLAEDARGAFMEAYRSDRFREAGIDAVFVQQNHSISTKNVLRGLHFQWDRPLGKLIRVVRGRVLWAGVDIRKKSETFGKWVRVELSDTNRKEVYVAPGFASGFCEQDDGAEVEYLYTALYNPKGESVILWNDPALGISWPVTDPILSPRDAAALTLAAWCATPESDLVV